MNFDSIRLNDSLFVYTNPAQYQVMHKNYGPADSVIVIPSCSGQFMKIPFLIPERRQEVLKEKLILIYYPFNAATANQAITPDPISSALSAISKVGVCTPEMMPFSLLPVPKR